MLCHLSNLWPRIDSSSQASLEAGCIQIPNHSLMLALLSVNMEVVSVLTIHQAKAWCHAVNSLLYVLYSC